MLDRPFQADPFAQVSAYKEAYVADLKNRNETLDHWKRAGKTSAEAQPPPSSQDREWDDKGSLLHTFASFGTEDSTPDTSADEGPGGGGGKVATRTLWPVRIYPKEGGSEPKVKGRRAIDEAGGVTIGGDREVQMKVVLGTTGSRHASLPDVSSLGYFCAWPASSQSVVRSHKVGRVHTRLRSRTG